MQEKTGKQVSKKNSDAKRETRRNKMLDDRCVEWGFLFISLLECQAGCRFSHKANQIFQNAGVQLFFFRWFYLKKPDVYYLPGKDGNYELQDI